MLTPRRPLRLAVPLFVLAACASMAAVGAPSPLAAQTPADSIQRIDLPSGRSYPITTPVPVSKVSVANPDVADVVVIGEQDIVINGKANGETDVILWLTGQPRRHYRVIVRSASDRQMVALGVKLAEVRKDLLRELGVSGLYRDPGGSTRVGSGLFRTDEVFDRETGDITVPGARFATVLTDFGTDQLLGFLDAEEARGRSRTLAEPTLLASNREEASFLAGGEFPVPVAQPGQGGQVTIVIQFREFGVRLRFTPEIVSDSLIKLRVAPEVSSLDYTNAVSLSGFRIPALRTRRAESTIDVRPDQSIILSGLFNEEREQVKTGIPFLMNIPILGNLFSSSRWQTNQSELLIIVSPTLVDPNRPGRRAIQIVPDTTLPAREAIEKRLPPASRPPRN